MPYKFQDIASLGTLIITGAQALATIGALVAGLTIMFAGKATPPSWVHRGMNNPKQTPVENADSILDDRYGKGNYPKAAGSKHSITRKFIEWIRGYIE